jgi:hypothetical protein
MTSTTSRTACDRAFRRRCGRSARPLATGSASSRRRQLVIEAQRKRDQILEQARIEGDGIRADAENYARTVITKLGEYIARIAASVDQTRDMLERDAEAEKQRRSGEANTPM